MTRTTVLSALLAGACIPTGFLGPLPADTGPDTQDTQDTTEPDDTGPPVDTGETGILEGDAYDLSWRLHDEYESLVHVSWTQDQATTVHVKYSVDDGEWLSSPSWELDAGTHEKLIVGIPYGMEAQWRVVTEGGAPTSGEPITTGDIPDGLPQGTVEVAQDSGWYADGLYLLSSINQQSGGWISGTYWTFIIDRQARPVWAQKAPQSHWTLFAQVSVTGDYFLWDEATYWSNWDQGRGSSVHKAYLDREIEEITTPGLHHAFVQLPNENLVWGSQNHGGGEALVEKANGAGDNDDGTVLWTCEQDWPGSGHCESNGLHYSAERDAFLYSFYTNNSVVEVDHSDGRSMWWAGEVRNGYDFEPADSQFSWQHGITYNADGHLMVSTHNSTGGMTTLVREYEVDHDARTLNQVWHYDANVFASTNGDAWRLPNGNTLHLLGSAGELKEVTEDGTVVWHVDWHAEKLLGRGELLTDLYALLGPDEG